MRAPTRSRSRCARLALKCDAIDERIEGAVLVRDLGELGELSHPDYRNITDEQYAVRMTLRENMLDAGFKPLDEEWWHFTLVDEPYPDTYFTFPVNAASVGK